MTKVVYSRRGKNLSLFPIEDSREAPVKQGALFNEWLAQNIKEMRSNRYTNIWRSIHKLASSEEEIGKIEEHVKDQVEREGRYNYYFVMFLLDTYR